MSTKNLKIWEGPQDLPKFSYKGVYGVIDTSTPKTVVIYEFSSTNPEKGEAREALLALRQEFKTIVVTDIGPEEEDAYQFWLHALQTRLVDELNDETGKVITRKTAGSRPKTTPYEEISEEKAAQLFKKSDRWKNITNHQGLIVIQQAEQWSDLCAIKGEEIYYLTTIPTQTYGKVTRPSRKNPTKTKK